MPRLKVMFPEIKKGKYGFPTSRHAKQIKQRDILRMKHKIDLPLEDGKRTCYVVSPGWHGREHYDEIPEDAFIIIVNYAIMIPAYCREHGIRELKPAIWLCADRNLATQPECKWFVDELDAIIEAGYSLEVENIKAGGPIVPIFDSGFLGGIFPVVRTTFSHGRSMRRKLPSAIPGRLRAGLTISCQAMQLAYWFKAETIKICGIDMWSDDYFDGHKTNVKARRNRAWPQCKHFDQFIRWLKVQGIRPVSISRTALKIEQPPPVPD